MNASILHCGPSGLAAPAKKQPGVHAIELLAQEFNCVEIKSSFSEDLRPEVTRLWTRKLEPFPDFQLTVKLHRRFTHERVLATADVAAFADGVAPLHRAGRLGCLLMQFPWSFRYTAENRAHLLRLARAFRAFPVVAEMRHASWMLDEAIGTFIDARIGFCNIDQPSYMKAMPPTAFLTSATGYVRLHGRNCYNWFGRAEHPARVPRYDYAYTEAELAAWVRRIDQIRGYAKRLFAIANNGPDGKAAATALEIRAMLAGKRVPATAPAQSALFTEYHGRAVALTRPLCNGLKTIGFLLPGGSVHNA